MGANGTEMGPDTPSPTSYDSSVVPQWLTVVVVVCTIVCCGATAYALLLVKRYRDDIAMESQSFDLNLLTNQPGVTLSRFQARSASSLQPSPAVPPLGLINSPFETTMSVASVKKVSVISPRPAQMFSPRW
eukprot:TRINITY_DN16760_c0_g1_i1.p1 TRINITY_DN16760_c0_g1~~TRINITY_DN16760_c0_g1_i1.p1  ORF type:complete len:131 (+),score=18.25 TRINITY_DN16760_c0_g1_i1:85-477(+)